MKFSTFSLMAAVLAAKAAAEDLLFINTLQGVEMQRAINMGFTVKVVDQNEWRSMTTADFAKFKAIILADDGAGGGTAAALQFADDTKAIWSPAVLGNVVLIGKSRAFVQNILSRTNIRRN